MAKETNTSNEHELRLRVLELACTIAHSQNSSKLTGDEKKDAEVENTVINDTLRNAKKLWKFVKVDPLAEKEPSDEA